MIIERPKLLVSRLDAQFLAPEEATAEREIQNAHRPARIGLGQ
jgi:hypothetical protein